MSAPSGFLVVRSVEPFRLAGKGSLRLRYRGVDRVPPYPSDDEDEQEAVEQYVFGNYKDDATNLIPSFDAAVRLQRSLSSSKHRYEILFCCEDPKAVQGIEERGVHVEHLGYDVAAIRGDYWSIVADFSANDWAARFRSCLNALGLFTRKEDAEAYLREYRDKGEPDSESPFDVVYVTRVYLDERQPADILAT
jgi:hypothetical protein